MLPFLAGLAVGSALTLLYAKREEVKKAINSPAFKDKVKETKRLSQQALSDVKDKMNSLLTNFKGENPTQKPKKASNSKSKSADKAPSKRGRKKKSPTSKDVAVPKTTATKSRAKKSPAKKSTTAKRTKKAAPSTTATPTSEITEAN